MTKTLVWQFCASALLLTKGCIGIPCNEKDFQTLEAQCVLDLRNNMKLLGSDLVTTNCSDLADFATCLKDSWRTSKCDNLRVFIRRTKTLILDIQRKHFLNCSGTLARCRPDKALQKLMKCGSRFYESADYFVANRSSESLASLCSKVDSYVICAYESQEEASCSYGRHILPDIELIAENVARKHHPLCGALQKMAFQKGTSACNRQRFINDIFLCGYHFANIADILNKEPSKALCKYVERYKLCQNASFETYGCAPPDQLSRDADEFYKILTEKFTEFGKCEGGHKEETIQISRLTLMNAIAHARSNGQLEIAALHRLGGYVWAERDVKYSEQNGPEYTCNASQFMGYFFKCSTEFVDVTPDFPRGFYQMCRRLRYIQCVERARRATHCNENMGLKSYASNKQKILLNKYGIICAARNSKNLGRNRPEEGTLPRKIAVASG